MVRTAAATISAEPLGIAETAAAQLRSLGNEFGLRPASERLLNMAAPRDDDDPFAG